MRQRSSPRLTAACEPCKRKKRKCNGARPFCSTCSRTPSACQYVRPNPRGLPPGYLIALEQRLADTEAALRLSVKIILELTLADAQPSPTSQECLDEDYSTLRAQNAVKHLASEPSLREMALEKICGRHSSPDTYPEKRERQGEWERWPLRSMTDVLSWWSCVDRAAAEDGKEGAAVVENSEAEDPYELPPAHFEDLELEDTPSQIIPDLNLQSLDKCRRQIDGSKGNRSNRQLKVKVARPCGTSTSATPRRGYPRSRNIVSSLSDNNFQESASPGRYVSTTSQRDSEDEDTRYPCQTPLDGLSTTRVSGNVRRLLELNPGWF